MGRLRAHARGRDSPPARRHPPSGTRDSRILRPLRVALLAYRGNPHSGGQGVYVHHLSKELDALGHSVEVFSGPPYPELAPGTRLTKVPSLDLYRPDDPFRLPHPRELRTLIDVAELALMCTAGFPEPLTFSLRVARLLRARTSEFDVVHDNQCLGTGILDIARGVLPVLATVHHPITVDRDLELAHAPSLVRKLTLRRWFGFVRMQQRVLNELPRVITVSESSKRDLHGKMGVALERMAVVPVGVDATHFRPLAHVVPVAGRIMTTASADVPLKGLVPLLEAVAKVRTEQPVELVVVGRLRDGSTVPAVIERLGLGDVVRLVEGVDAQRLVELYAEAEVAVVPSLYEGFSLPAIEAMACGVPLVATTGGALPEVVGRHGESGLLVPPGDPGALAGAILEVLRSPELRHRLGAAGRARVLDRFTWEATARGTVDQYRLLLQERREATAPC